MPDHTPTTLHNLETFLRGGGRYTAAGETLRYDLWYQDGRFYVQAGPGAPVPYDTVGVAVVALLLHLGVVEVPHGN